jgi:hypothetical protein
MGELREALARTRPHLPPPVFRDLVIAVLRDQDAWLDRYKESVRESDRMHQRMAATAKQSAGIGLRAVAAWKRESLHRIEGMLAANRDKYARNVERDAAIVADAKAGVYTHAELMRRHCVSRATLFRVLKRSGLTRSR